MAVIYSWCLSLLFSHCRPYCRNLKRKLERLVAWRETGDHVVNIGRRRKITWNPHPNLQFSCTSLQPSSLVKSTPCPHHCEDYNVHFTKGVKPNVQLKSSIPIGAKIEISPKGFTLGVKAEIEKIFSICPNAELYGLYWPQGWKRDTIELIWETNLQPLGPRF